MGRHQYLERLALGRSPFQDAHPDIQASELAEAGYPSVSQPAGESYEQQYDSKGRPVNPATEQRNQAMRNAQNAVLALVGVVESKDQSDRIYEQKQRDLRKTRQHLREHENDRGEDLEIAENFLHPLLTWWPDMLVSRIQAGIYPLSMGFCEIVTLQFNATRHASLLDSLAGFFAGMPAWIMSNLLNVLLRGGVDVLMNRLEIEVAKRIKKQRNLRGVDTAVAVVCECLYLAIDVALLPLEFYESSQILGLAPPRSLFPNWRSFFYSSPSSMHNYIWSPTTSFTWFALLTSPAALLVSSSALTRNQDDGYPISNQVTSFEYPSVGRVASMVKRPDVLTDPAGRLFYYAYLTRFKILRWLGWRIVDIGQDIDVFDTTFIRPHTCHRNHHNTYSSRSQPFGLSHVHRTNFLTRRPVLCLAASIDGFFSYVFMLPFKGMVHRAIAQSYLFSPLSKTPLAIAATQTCFQPFGGGPFTRSSWSEVGSYLNKLGLGLALYAATDVVIFYGVYRLVRWQGIRNFAWGSEGNYSAPKDTHGLADNENNETNDRC